VSPTAVTLPSIQSNSGDMKFWADAEVENSIAKRGKTSILFI
jgi:hypothetical protein